MNSPCLFFLMRFLTCQSFSGPSMAKLDPIHVFVQREIWKTDMKVQKSAVFGSAFDVGVWDCFAIFSQSLLSSITINKAGGSHFCGGLEEHLGLDMGHPFLSLGLEHPFPHSTKGWQASCPLISWTLHDAAAAALVLETTETPGWQGLTATKPAGLVAVGGHFFSSGAVEVSRRMRGTVGTFQKEEGEVPHSTRMVRVGKTFQKKS